MSRLRPLVVVVALVLAEALPDELGAALAVGRTGAAVAAPVLAAPAGKLSVIPSDSRPPSSRALSRISASVLVPKRWAMSHSVSPSATVYVLPCAAAVAAVDEAAGPAFEPDGSFNDCPIDSAFASLRPF